MKNVPAPEKNDIINIGKLLNRWREYQENTLIIPLIMRKINENISVKQSFSKTVV